MSTHRPIVWLLGGLALLGAACEREARERALPALAEQPLAVDPGRFPERPHAPAPLPAAPFEGRAVPVNEGKRLYGWFNCVGCHSHGGGGMGPALMDATWVYGSEPEVVFASIQDGRPNGMPAFRGKLSDEQIWEIVAYVRSMSGLLRTDVAPSRADGMSVTEPEQSRKREIPVRASAP